MTAPSEIHLVLEHHGRGMVTVACMDGPQRRNRETQTLLSLWATCSACEAIQAARVVLIEASR